MNGLRPSGRLRLCIFSLYQNLILYSEHPWRRRWRLVSRNDGICYTIPRLLRLFEMHCYVIPSLPSPQSFNHFHLHPAIHIHAFWSSRVKS